MKTHRATKSPLVSIVIINKNDRAIHDTLQACVSLEAKQSYEVIVVDSSKGKLDYISKEFPTVKWITFQPLPHKHISIPEQRNVGVLSATGDIIVFIDANCIPEKGWLTNLVEPILKQNESIVVGATFSQGKATTHDQAHAANKSKQYIEEFATINLAFSRKVYDALGGFDERFDYGSDVDFSWRAIDAGFRIRYQPTAVITHDWGDPKQELKRSFYYGKARARLHIKHKRLKYLFTTDIITVIYPLFILGLPITIWWHWYPLLIIVPLAKNYNKKPLSTLRDHFAYGLGAIYEFIFAMRRRMI